MISKNAVENHNQKTTLNISLTIEDKRFLKVFAAQNGITISSMIHEYIESLRNTKAEESKKEHIS